MDNTAHPELAALDERILRMRRIADQLLLAYEAADIPKDHMGIARAARALIALDRLIKALYAQKKAAAQPADDALLPEPLPERLVPEPVTAPRNRQERRRLEAGLRKLAA